MTRLHGDSCHWLMKESSSTVWHIVGGEGDEEVTVSKVVKKTTKTTVVSSTEGSLLVLVINCSDHRRHSHLCSNFIDFTTSPQ